MTRAEIKAKAREDLGKQLFGKTWLMALLLTVVYTIVIGASSFVGGIGQIILIGPMTIGYYTVLLGVSRRKEEYDIGKMFSEGFGGDFGRALLIGLLKNIFVILWSLLLVIPGIIKNYSYSQAEFIAIDHPEYDWKQCIDESKAIMKGHKWQLFVLDLSFIGWGIVCSFTMGIGCLWLVPYIMQSKAVFYRNLINDTKYDDVATEYVEAETV